MSNFNTLTEVAESKDDAYFLTRQDGIDVKVKKENLLKGTVDQVKMRTDSASQLGLVYDRDWFSGITIPDNAMTNKLAYWYNGQFYSIGTDAGFTSNDFEVDLSAGRFVDNAIVSNYKLKSLRYFAPIYITDLANSSAEMNALILKVQQNGGGTIDLGDETYTANPIIDQDDGYKTAWHVPYTSDQSQAQTKGIEFRLGSGCVINQLENNSITLRASNNFVKVTGSGVFRTSQPNVLHVGFVPDDMNQTTRGSQQFCVVEPTVAFTGGYAAVTFQPGATVAGSDSGSYKHRVGFTYFDVDYPVWFKQPPHSTQNLTTTTFLDGIRGHVCVSAGKFEACDAHMQNCEFEGMSGEVIDFVTKGDPSNTIDNNLKISNCDFEVFAASTHLERWGVVLGANNKFVGGNVTISETRSPNYQYGKQVFGSYGVVNVNQHVTEFVVTNSAGAKKAISFINDVSTGMTFYSNTSGLRFNLPEVDHQNTVTYFRGREFILGGGSSASDYTQNSSEYGHIIRPNSASLPNGGIGFGIRFPATLGNYTCYGVQNNDGTYLYKVNQAGDAYNVTGTFGTLSDPRTKSDWTKARNYTDDLMKLEVGTYNSLVNNEKLLGLRTDNVKSVFPNLVEKTNDSVTLDNGDVIENVELSKTSPLLFMLIKGFQEQQKEIENLKLMLENNAS